MSVNNNINRGSFFVKKTVLVVDDEEINVEILSSILEDTFHVIKANDGKEALDILLSGICPYYLIPSLLEFGLPQYSTEMYLMIVDIEKGKSLVSAHDSQESAMSDAYVNAFMYKQLYKFVKGK